MLPSNRKCEKASSVARAPGAKALEKKRAVRPAHVVEAELRALEPKLKQAKREESQATDEWKKLEKEIRGCLLEARRGRRC